MNFKQTTFLIYAFGFFLETFCIENVIAIHNAENNIRREKGSKKYMRNEHGNKQSDNSTTSEGISDSDLAEILNVKSSDKSIQSLSEGDRDHRVPAFSEIGALLNEDREVKTLSRDVEEMNCELKNLNENDHSDDHKITQDIEKYPTENGEKHKRRRTSIREHDANISEEENKKEKDHSSSDVSSGNTMNKIEDSTENDENTYTIAEELIDQLSDLLFDSFDNYSNNNGQDRKNEKTQTNTNGLSDTVNGIHIDSSRSGEDTNNITNDEDDEEEIDDIEPKIKKEIYYPLGENKAERFIQEINETITANDDNVNNETSSSMSIRNENTMNEECASESQEEVTKRNSEEPTLSNSLNAEPRSGNYEENTTKRENHISFLQKDSQEMDETILNEDENSDNENSKEENVSTDEEESTNNIEEEKINEDTNLASFDTEEDTDETNKNNKDDSSTRKEKKLIRNARKVYKLNLFNCNYINDWDFSKEYVDEQGTLVKLSGYVFQNMLNSNSMPTASITEWKLKGACDYDKYVCGALKYFDNVYQKGDRVIFENKIYEALNDTVKSPKDDDGTWVDKTSECFDL